jgi:hypothetical protein
MSTDQKNNGRKDLEQFLLLAASQLKRRLAAEEAREPRSELVKDDKYWTLRLLEGLIKEQVTHEDSGHSTRAPR